MDILIGATATTLYLIFGLGVARLVAKARRYEPNPYDAIAWPIVLLVCAFA